MKNLDSPPTWRVNCQMVRYGQPTSHLGNLMEGLQEVVWVAN
jgi:hypothetical protein